MKNVFLGLFLVACLTVHAQILQDYNPIGFCDQQWTPAYAHDYRGYAKVGSLSTLEDHILEGYMVRVQFSTQEWLMTFGVDDFTFRGSTICGSSMYIFSDNGTHIETDADWLPTLVCTNGVVSRLNYTTATWEREVGYQDVLLDSSEIWWYTKPSSCDKEPVYSHFVDGSKSTGSLQKLIRMAKWSELRANMRDRGFAFVLQNQKIYNDELVAAQSLNHVSLRYTDDAVKFNDAPYYNWLSSWSTNGRRDVSRWLTNSTVPYRHNNDFISIDWYGDSCWRRVYSTDEFGLPSYGSLEELIQMIKLGHRVRIYFEGNNLKANGIRVVDDLIIAQTIEEYERRGNYPNYDAPFFEPRPRVTYRLIHSTGRVKTYKYFYDNFELSESDVLSKYALDWLVDTRPWVNVLRTDASGMITSGNLRDLEESVATGASVRLNIEQDELAGQFFTEADNVRNNFYTNEVYAQALKHVSDQKLQSSEEYILQANVFRWSLMVSSSGVVAMNARRLASKSHMYDAVSPATNVTWFINV